MFIAVIFTDKLDKAGDVVNTQETRVKFNSRQGAIDYVWPFYKKGANVHRRSRVLIEYHNLDCLKAIIKLHPPDFMAY